MLTIAIYAVFAYLQCTLFVLYVKKNKPILWLALKGHRALFIIVYALSPLAPVVLLAIFPYYYFIKRRSRETEVLTTSEPMFFEEPEN